MPQLLTFYLQHFLNDWNTIFFKWRKKNTILGRRCQMIQQKHARNTFHNHLCLCYIFKKINLLVISCFRMTGWLKFSALGKLHCTDVYLTREVGLPKNTQKIFRINRIRFFLQNVSKRPFFPNYGSADLPPPQKWPSLHKRCAMC